ncbi:hypothetical protein F8M41_001007 [Gigaspora margarita]|uniref:Secreted protein n=1 Tax=Gigaspora margarita TaxID=4874 RepID=A0A8H4AZB1_GIGMA|nr:hypothetical protein F8M41_001007 [Gigaspora margarita]
MKIDDQVIITLLVVLLITIISSHPVKRDDDKDKIVILDVGFKTHIRTGHNQKLKFFMENVFFPQLWCTITNKIT